MVEPSRFINNFNLQRTQMHSNSKNVLNSMDDLHSISDESQHAVTLIDSLHRMPWFRGDSSVGLEKSLKEVSRILKKDGVGYLSMRSRKKEACPVYYEESSNVFKQAVTLEEMEDLLMKFGMSEIDSKVWEVDVDGRVCPWLNVTFEKH